MSLYCLTFVVNSLCHSIFFLKASVSSLKCPSVPWNALIYLELSLFTFKCPTVPSNHPILPHFCVEICVFVFLLHGIIIPEMPLCTLKYPYVPSHVLYIALLLSWVPCITVLFFITASICPLCPNVPVFLCSYSLMNSCPLKMHLYCLLLCRTPCITVLFVITASIFPRFKCYYIPMARFPHGLLSPVPAVSRCLVTPMFPSLLLQHIHTQAGRQEVKSLN